MPVVALSDEAVVRALDKIQRLAEIFSSLAAWRPDRLRRAHHGGQQAPRSMGLSMKSSMPTAGTGPVAAHGVGGQGDDRRPGGLAAMAPDGAGGFETVHTGICTSIRMRSKQVSRARWSASSPFTAHSTSKPASCRIVTQKPLIS